MPLVRARLVVQVHPGPPFFQVTGCCSPNLNPQASPHFTAPLATSSIPQLFSGAWPRSPEEMAHSAVAVTTLRDSRFTWKLSRNGVREMNAGAASDFVDFFQ